MKKQFSKLVVVATICIPLVLSAAESVKVDRGNIQEGRAVHKVPTKVSNSPCPSGWTKVLDISNSKKWKQNVPVVTCKPNRGQVMNCPRGTYFYVKGNETEQGYNTGVIGCHTPIR